MKAWEYRAKTSPPFSVSGEKDFQTNESKSHNLTSNDATELGEESSRKSGEVNHSKVTEAFTQNQVKVPNGAQKEPTPSLNKGSGEKAADKVCYHLPPILLHNLMAWVAKFHELRVQHPNGLILNAQPHHVIEASEAYPWGVVYDLERYLLTSWGDVPKVTLLGLRDLETGELLIPEAVAA